MNSRGSSKRRETGSILPPGEELAEIARHLNGYFRSTERANDDAADRLDVPECVHVAYGIYWARRQRDRLLGSHLFAEPAWDILLDLFIAGQEGRKVSVTSACIASAVPTSTALRRIHHLVEIRLVLRIPHPADARITFLELSKEGISQMTDYFTLLSRVQNVHAA